MECIVCKTGEYKPWGLGDKLCEMHDVCVDCGVKRKALTESPWGVRRGAFQCKPCEAKERAERIADRKKNGFDHLYTDEIVCPHCGYEYSDSWELNGSSGEQECPECYEPFELEVTVTVNYSTSKLKEDKTP